MGHYTKGRDSLDGVAFHGVGFPIAVSTDALMAMPELLDDIGPLMRLWRREKHCPRVVVTEHHVGIDLKPSDAVAASYSFERVFANPTELPA